VLISRMKENGIHLDQDAFRREFRQRLTDYYEQRDTEFIELTTGYVLSNTLADFGFADIDETLLGSILEGMYGVSQTYWKPEKDAAATLRKLQQDGYRLGVISNAGDDADVQILVDRSGLRQFFDFVLSSAACGIRKPNPRIFELALGHWGIDGKEAAMVGDKLGADILGAHNAGMLGIWITRRAEIPSNRDHAHTIHPDATIGALAELPELLQKLNT